MNWASVTDRLSASRFLRFGVVGAGGFVVDTGVFAALHDFGGWSPFTARAVSIMAGMTFTWWGNRTLTFREHAATHRAGMLREWLRFVAANSLGALLNYATFAALVAFAPLPFANRYVALICGVLVGLVFNFTLSKRFVFRPPTSL